MDNNNWEIVHNWDEVNLVWFAPESFVDARTERWGSNNIHCCAYSCYEGEYHWSDWADGGNRENWADMRDMEADGTIGLLLDLDEGTLTVYMNGSRLGVMKEGLSGEYSWFTSVSNANSVRIERGIPRQ